MIAILQPAPDLRVADDERRVRRLQLATELVISPELVLVDPELAELARGLLPDYPVADAEDDAAVAVPQRQEASPLPSLWRPGDAGSTAAILETAAPDSIPQQLRAGADASSWSLATAGVAEAERAPLRPARWIVVTAVAALAAAAVFAARDLLPELDESAPSSDSAQTLVRDSDAQPLPPTVGPGPARKGGSEPAPARRTSTTPTRPTSPPSVGEAVRTPPASPPSVGKAVRTPPASPPRDSGGARTAGSKARAGTPPSNVLGVVVTPGDARVSLSWARPSDSHHVVVLREREVRRGGKAVYGDGKVVYRGGGTTYQDRGVKNGVEYRYVIINYDRAGNASSGVRTVVVPQRIPPGA